MSVGDILKQLNEAHQMARAYENYGQEQRRAEELKKLVDKEVDKAGKTLL
jgi:hypothetical protein